MKEVIFHASDGLEIRADLYENENAKAPIILLCHQAGFSRGEYLETAPKLVKRGYTCLALDQRSGNTVNEVDNITARNAHAKGLEQSYMHAFPDIEAAILYLESYYPENKLMILGSSYSSVLALIVGSLFPKIEAVASFSPGEYFTFNHRSAKDWAKDLTKPVFITSAAGEVDAWKPIFDVIPEGKKVSLEPKGPGIHGSRNLWESTPNSVEYWEAFDSFLNTYFKA